MRPGRATGACTRELASIRRTTTTSRSGEERVVPVVAFVEPKLVVVIIFVHVVYVVHRAAALAPRQGVALVLGALLLLLL